MVIAAVKREVKEKWINIADSNNNQQYKKTSHREIGKNMMTSTGKVHVFYHSFVRCTEESPVTMECLHRIRAEISNTCKDIIRTNTCLDATEHFYLFIYLFFTYGWNFTNTHNFTLQHRRESFALCII